MAKDTEGLAVANMLSPDEHLDDIFEDLMNQAATQERFAKVHMQKVEQDGNTKRKAKLHATKHANIMLRIDALNALRLAAKTAGVKL